VLTWQVRLSRFVVDPITATQVAVFQYAQRILEIMFVGIILSCCLTTFLPTLERESIMQRMRGGVRTGTLMGKQLNSIVVNMQVSGCQSLFLSTFFHAILFVGRSGHLQIPLHQ